MKIERMELVGLEVNDLDAAMAEFSALLDTTFIRVDFGSPGLVRFFPADVSQEGSDASISVAMDRKGYLELIQTHPPTSRERVRNIHFKVDDIDAAIAMMRSRGHRLVQNLQIGTMREAVFGARETRGLRMCLVQYDASSMIDAMLEAPDA
ncbi:VOC family protein [Aeromicrobium sp. HA]|uniref:VOC family protein n=1 Tax=Aeromicrobium sp. HA TaxID=3009077 RepID=UPI0022AF7F2C|nr:VOC family protein [Aeromicrobium sp. HA]